MIKTEAEVGQVVITWHGNSARRVQILGRPKYPRPTYRGFILADEEEPRKNYADDEYVDLMPEDILSVEEGKYVPVKEDYLDIRLGLNHAKGEAA